MRETSGKTLQVFALGAYLNDWGQQLINWTFLKWLSSL